MYSITSNRLFPSLSLLDTVFPSPSGFKIDIQEDENRYNIRAELPGYDKSNIEVRIEKGLVTISATKSQEKSDENSNYIYRESSYGSVTRQIAFKDIDEAQAEARYENGILTVTVPKKESAKERKIEIK